MTNSTGHASISSLADNMMYQPALTRALAFLFLLSAEVAHAQDIARDAVPRINVLFLEARYEDALRACDDFLQRSPRHPQIEVVRLIKACCYVRLQKPEEAAKDFDELIELHPQYADGYFARGWNKCQLLDFKEAVTDFESGFRQESHSIESVARGRFTSGVANWDKINEALDNRLAQAPTDKVNLFVRALVRMDEYQYKAAVKELDSLIQAHPNYAYAHHVRGNAQFNLGLYEKALSDFELTIKLEPNDLAAGQMQKIVANKLKALIRLNELIAENPKDASRYAQRGNIRVKHNDLEAAIVDFDEAIKIEPENANYLTLRALAKKNMKDLTGAIKDYDELVRIDSKNIESHLIARSACKSEAGNYAGAIQDYDQLIALKPKSANLYRARGVVKNGMNDHAAALKDFDEAILLGEQSVREIRAHTRLMQKDYSGVLEDTDVLIQQDPKHPVAYQLRSLARRSMREFNEAIEELNEAIRLNANSPGNLYQRGYCKLYLKDYAGALADFDRALKMSFLIARSAKAVVLAIADSDLRDPAESLRTVEEASNRRPNGYDQNAKACALAALGKFAEAIELEESISDPAWLKDEELLGGIIAPERIAAWKAGKQWQP